MAEYDPTAEPQTYEWPDESFEDGGDDQNDIQPAEDEDEDDDYDPSSFTFDASAGDVQSTELMQPDELNAPVATSEEPAKPKTFGGFIVEDGDDDDEEDEEEEQGITAPPPPSQLNGTEGSHSGLGAVAVAEAADEATALDVPIASEPQDTAAVSLAQQMPAQSARLNGSTSPPAPVPVSNTESAFVPPSALSSLLPASGPSVQSPAPPASDQQGKQHTLLSTAGSAPQSATATPQPLAGASTVATAPPPPHPQANGSVPATPTTQRLPHDKVGNLEDRIKEDPKGDLEAWRGLIAHYREKGQLDNARSVYTRFFEVFPSAVCLIIPSILIFVKLHNAAK